MIEGPAQTFTRVLSFLLLSKNEGCDCGNCSLLPFNFSCPLPAIILNHDITVLRIWNCTLVDLQLDAQNSYLFTYSTFIKILYMFRAVRCSSLGGLRRNCIYAASGIVTQ